jgi:regulator of sigma E protease
LTTFLATLLVLGVLIFVHELGHFLVAKWAGIKVERFSLGFPPKMIGFTRGETEYCISWIPLGGYVKMAGENPDESEITGDPREFMSKSVGVRALVIIAGPLMNFVAAILLFAMAFFFYGKPVPDTTRVIVGSVSKGYPAEKIGLKSGDQIVSIDHQKVGTFPEMAGIVNAKPGQIVDVTWKRGDDIYSSPVVTKIDTAKTAAGADSLVGRIGIGPGFITEPMGLFASLGAGFTQTIDICGAMFKFLGGLLSGQVSIKLVSGPVGIAKMAGEFAREGFNMLMGFMAVLSVNLAILNVLPVPILDGGHLLFLLIEKLRGRPLSIRQRAIAQQVGLGLLVLLIVTVTYNDILRLFGA